jgi:hypothetical protein
MKMSALGLLILDGQVVRGELCTCGHERIEHGNNTEVGHGQCIVRDCKCKRFRWKKWLYATKETR